MKTAHQIIEAATVKIDTFLRDFCREEGTAFPPPESDTTAYAMYRVCTMSLDYFAGLLAPALEAEKRGEDTRELIATAQAKYETMLHCLQAEMQEERAATAS